MTASAPRHRIVPLLAVTAVCALTPPAFAAPASRPAPYPAIPLALQSAAAASAWNAVRWPAVPESRGSTPGVSEILDRSPALRARVERATLAAAASIAPSNAGRTVVQTQDTDVNLDGTSDLRFIITSTYDLRGNLTRYLLERDQSFDQVIDQRYVETFEYDPQDNLTRHVIEFDNEADGHLEFRFAARMVYGPHGYLVESRSDTDSDGNGTSDVRFTLTATRFDSRGNPLQVVEDTDNHADGTVETRTYRNLTYDSRGNLVREAAASDYGVNGTIDDTFVATAAYDDHNNVVGVKTEEDKQGDGVIDVRFAESIAYDAHDQPVRDVAEYDRNADGLLEMRTTTTNRYNRSGTLVEWVEEDDAGGDGVVDSRSALVTFESDRQERPLRQAIEIDINADGVIDIRYSIGLTYGSHGNLVREVIDNDFGGDGRTDSRVTITFEYGGNPRPPHAPAWIGDGLSERLAMAAPVLAAAAPNPSRDLATLRYVLPRAGQVELSIYDAGGRRLRTLVGQVAEAGEHRVVWDGRDDSGRRVAPGVYFARLKAGARETSQTLLRIN